MSAGRMLGMAWQVAALSLVAACDSPPGSGQSDMDAGARDARTRRDAPSQPDADARDAARFEPREGICSTNGWCWQNPLPQGGHLNGVGGSGPDDVWAVGDGGLILHFDGSSWSRVPSGTHNDLQAVWAVSPQDAWAVGDHGTILWFHGLVWSKVRGRSTADFYDVWASGPKDVWIVGAEASLVHYDSSGWSRMSYERAHEADTLLSVWGNGHDDVWVVGHPYEALHFDGTDWLRDTIPVGDVLVSYTLNMTWAAGAGDVWAGGLESFSHYDGKSWRHNKAPTDATLFDMWGSDSKDVWAVGEDGTILHYDGTGWIVEPTQIDQHLKSVWGSGPQDVWAVGNEGLIAHYDGASWMETSERILSRPRAQRKVNTVASMWGTSSTDLWAAGYSTIAHFDGSSWSEAWSTSGYRAWVYDVFGFGTDDVWAVGPIGVLRYDGSHWAAQDVAGSNYALGWGSGPQDVWAAHGAGTLAHYDGTRWAHIHIADDVGRFTAGWSAASNDAWLATDDYRQPNDWLWHYDGAEWQKMFEVQSVEAMWGQASDDVWAVGYGGAAFHYDGVSWKAVPSGTDENLFAVWGRASDDVWAAGSMGTVVHYDGRQWSSVHTGTEAFLKAVWGSSDGHLWVGGNNGAILHRQ